MPAPALKGKAQILLDPTEKKRSKSITLKFHLLFWCAGKGRGRKRKGSGSEEDYSPVKKVTKPAGKVSFTILKYFIEN